MVNLEYTDNTIKNLFSLEGKVAIVTGGAGGMGQAVSRAYAMYGADVVVTGRTVETLLETVEIIESHGRKALAIKCDVTDEAQVEAMVQQVKDEFGKVDILCTVAGIAKRHPAEDFDMADFDQVMDINVKGTFLCCKHVGKLMIEQGNGGKIVTVSSVRAEAGHPAGYGAYGASKAAVSLITKQLAVEWAKHNINVNSIAPCVFYTPLTAPVLDDPKVRKIFLDRIPMNKPAVAEDTIGAAIYLSSDASNFITGHVVFVDGGTNAY
jgi:gluconate 5-dehydrogenase